MVYAFNVVVSGHVLSNQSAIYIYIYMGCYQVLTTQCSMLDSWSSVAAPSRQAICHWALWRTRSPSPLCNSPWSSPHRAATVCSWESLQVCLSEESQQCISGALAFVHNPNFIFTPLTRWKLYELLQRELLAIANPSQSTGPPGSQPTGPETGICSTCGQLLRGLP